MTREQYKQKFKTCVHDWTLHMDADSGDRKSNSIFMCENCKTIVTMLERNSLDSLKLKEKAMKDSLLSQQDSQKIQEKSIRISAWTAALTIVVAVIVFLFGDGILK
ncbi:MAG: hypothetical protein KBD55_00460 [Candidatus Pacebacteria bacterium]|nr:hypothetical protein [Candidatus Paceibacterota bacterium]